MRLTALLLTLLFLSSCEMVSSKTADSLFNGVNLDGWTQRNGTATFEVVDGTIVGTTAEGSPNSFLCTDKSYTDFDLSFEVKVDNELNSGVQIRSQTEGGFRGRVNGPQVEIEATGHPKGGEAGYIFGEACGGWMTPLHKRAKHKHFKDGEWNDYRVLVKGANIKVWINGTMVTDLSDMDKFKSHPSGFIALQVHSIKQGKGPFKVAWRNITLIDLAE